MKPNFKDINIKSTEKATTAAAEWEKLITSRKTG